MNSSVDKDPSRLALVCVCFEKVPASSFLKIMYRSLLGFFF